MQELSKRDEEWEQKDQVGDVHTHTQMRLIHARPQMRADGAEVVEWLRDAKLERFAENLIADGFETLEDIQVGASCGVTVESSI